MILLFVIFYEVEHDMYNVYLYVDNEVYIQHKVYRFIAQYLLNG